jgi:hypothetical protein
MKNGATGRCEKEPRNEKYIYFFKKWNVRDVEL